MDPKNPGAVDEIVNFGDFWNEAGFKGERETILKLNKEVGQMFRSAYRCLSGAKELQDDIEAAAEEAVDKMKYDRLCLDIRAELTGHTSFTGRAGRERHLFHTALTPDGIVDYIETLITDSFKCCLFKGINSKGNSDALNTLAREYLLKGYDVEIYHQPLNPERIETVLVERLGIALTADSKVQKKAYRIVDMDEAVDKVKLHDREGLINRDAELKELLLGEAFNRINMAKKKHDEMEKSYVPQMDFAAIAEFRKKFIERIKKYL